MLLRNSEFSSYAIIAKFAVTKTQTKFNPQMASHKFKAFVAFPYNSLNFIDGFKTTFSSREVLSAG